MYQREAYLIADRAECPDLRNWNLEVYAQSLRRVDT